MSPKTWTYVTGKPILHQNTQTKIFWLIILYFLIKKIKKVIYCYLLIIQNIFVNV